MLFSSLRLTCMFPLMVFRVRQPAVVAVPVDLATFFFFEQSHRGFHSSLLLQLAVPMLWVHLSASPLIFFFFHLAP